MNIGTMLAYLLLSLTQKSASEVLEHANRFLKSSDTLAVSIKSTLNSQVLGTGKLEMDRPYRLSYSFGGQTYFHANESGAIDVNLPRRTYDQFPYFGRIYVPPSRVGNSMQMTCPGFLISGTLAGLFPARAKLRLSAAELAGGKKVDLLQTHVEGNGAKSDIYAWIDGQGKVLRLRVNSTTPRGPLDLDYSMSNYVVNTKIPSTNFSIRIPRGFSPFALASAQGTVEAGETLPNIRLRSKDGVIQVPANLKGSNGVIAICDPEFPRGREFMDSVRVLASKIPNAKIVWIGTSTKPLANMLYDSSGIELAKWDVPGAPLVILVDRNGKVLQSYFGFDGTWENLDEVIARFKSGA